MVEDSVVDHIFILGVSIYIYIYIMGEAYIYIYIERERERERKKGREIMESQLIFTIRSVNFSAKISHRNRNVYIYILPVIDQSSHLFEAQIL